ncbi:sodium:glutamate symporter [Paraliobacillus quinghaiensis]|uniref:Sodium:glutamate symporter n=1 Tax=Paraliobacillus quinghaiensis TaxID=470815 RepID=A0A917TNF4_9BACI|nr:sodium/glutamate symporter [Paraliobacillus quinghaiensis]GGM30436.1 sodium:glutamate symporter [Paraliobacillus quinghaiensis]
MEFQPFLIALFFLSLLILIGKWLKIKLTIFQNYFIPTSIIAGFIGLILGPQVLGTYGPSNLPFLEDGLFTAETIRIWRTMPEILITIIFAALFLGKSIPNIKEIWIKAGPQVSYGQTVAWGQYVVGIILSLVVLTPFLGLPPAAGALIEISFEGGPGTAAGLASTFESINFSEGADLSLGLATIGVLSGVITGVIAINWGVRNNKTSYAKPPSELSSEEKQGIITNEDTASAGSLTTFSQSVESLTIHTAFIAFAIGVGMLIQIILVQTEELIWGSLFNVYIIEYVPLFPMAMLGGIITQVLSTKVFKYNIINRRLIERLQGLSLDLLIVTAVSTLSLTVISEHIVAFLIIAVTGIAWNITAFVLLAPRMIPSYWFERGVVDLGQSMGMTTTSLLLLQIVDPERKTPTFESFGYKQLLFEPIVGGGLFTASSLPLLVQFGPYPVLIITGVLFVFWLIVGLRQWGY